MKIRPVGADGRTGRQASRRTDMMRLIVAFRYITNAPKSTIYIFKNDSITPNALGCSKSYYVLEAAAVFTFGD